VGDVIKRKRKIMNDEAYERGYVAALYWVIGLRDNHYNYATDKIATSKDEIRSKIHEMTGQWVEKVGMDLEDVEPKNEYTPDHISPPGDTIKDLLEERNIPEIKLGFALLMSRLDLNDLLDGETVITNDIAQKLEEFFVGPKAEFWLKRDGIYQAIKRAAKGGAYEVDEHMDSLVGSDDMTGVECEDCGGGDYQETGQLDDKDGVLHCTSCRKEVNRWRNYG